MINVCLINLGCAKNLVDSEAILALFDKDSRFKITIDENEADVLILNTCAFIFDAENESFETIEELSKLNKKLVVLGCLVEKYKNELKKKFPKVNLFVGFKDFYRLPELLGTAGFVLRNGRGRSPGSFVYCAGESFLQPDDPRPGKAGQPQRKMDKRIFK